MQSHGIQNECEGHGFDHFLGQEKMCENALMSSAIPQDLLNQQEELACERDCEVTFVSAVDRAATGKCHRKGL